MVSLMEGLRQIWAVTIKFLEGNWHWVAISLITVGAAIYFYSVFSAPKIVPPYP